jgi:hypothetical protein
VFVVATGEATVVVVGCAAGIASDVSAYAHRPTVDNIITIDKVIKLLLFMLSPLFIFLPFCLLSFFTQKTYGSPK